MHQFTRIVIVVVCISCVGSLSFSQFDYPDFSSVGGLNLVGVCAQAGNRLRLTPSTSNLVGGAWYNVKQPMAYGFETTFQFQISGLVSGGADGFALVVQNQVSTALGDAGGGIGYSGIPNSVGIEFDTWLNPEANDPSANHVSVQTRGILPNDGHHNFSLGQTSSIPNLSDGLVHTVRVSFFSDTLRIYLDDPANAVLTVRCNIDSILTLEDGSAWIGFTAATGGSSETHDILVWSFSSSPVYSLNLTSPNGGENWQAGTSENISWTVSGLANLRIDMSTDNGASWPVVITSSVPASSGAYTWMIPNSPSAQCKVRISDVSNPSVSDISDAPFTIVGPPSTIVITHGFKPNLFGPTNWSDYKWQFCMADSVSDDRQICLIHQGQTYITYDHSADFQAIPNGAQIDQLIGTHFFPLTNSNQLDRNNDVVLIFDWVEESDRNAHGFSEAAGDALAAALIDNTRLFPWLLEHLHFVGHSRGAVVNSECIERLLYFASNDILPASVTLDQNIHMTTLDPHPAGHWQGAFEAMNDDEVNSRNITYNGKRFGVVGWRSGLYKVAYIDNFYQQLPNSAFWGMDGFPGAQSNTNLNSRFDILTFSAHQLVHTWYHGTVNLDAGNDEFNNGSGHTIQRSSWYSPPPGDHEGFHFSRGRTADLTPIASVESQLKEVWLDDTFAYSRLVFNGDFSSFSELFGLPGWDMQGGGGDGEVNKYDNWALNPHLELSQAHSFRRHNPLYIPTNATFLNFRLRIRNKSDDDLLKVYLGNTLMLVKPLRQTRSYQWETADVPVTLRGESTTIAFVLDGQGSAEARIWIDDVGFSPIARMVATVASPVFLHAYDAFGNHTGPTSDSTWATEIPGSQYVFESDTLEEPRKAIILPPPPSGTEYRFEIRSRNATGHFNFQIEDYTTGGQTVNIVFDTVAIQPTTVAACTLSTVTPSLRLSVDIDGNGIPDTTLSGTQYHQDFFIVSTAGAHGSITPDDTMIVSYGDSVTFAIVPDSAYGIADVLVDGSSVGPIAQYGFNNIQSDHTIHAVFSPLPVTIGIPLSEGWNLISNPVTSPVPGDSVKQLYPTSINPYAYEFSAGYVQRYMLVNGKGYWAKFPSAVLQSITGESRTLDSVNVVAGWNMIGSISQNVDTSTIMSEPTGLRLSPWFGFTAGYVPTTQIVPGKAYWVKAASAGNFILTVTGPDLVMSLASDVNELEGLSTIKITDSNGGSQTLYVGADGGAIPVNMYAMPPMPPSGSFDARFETSDGGSMVQVHAAEVRNVITMPIAIQSSAYPLTITWNVKGKSTYELSAGGLTNAVEGEGCMKVTDEGVERLMLRVTGSGDRLPKEFALAQNYPNPFNPSTTIKYDLPTDARVSLKIYNVLGQEVATLVNEQQHAGYRSVEWNASNVASGVYLYRLQAGNFTQTRKLLLLK